MAAAQQEEASMMSSRRCYLLELPPELRLIIYSMALGSQTQIKVRNRHYVVALARRGKKFYTHLPALLITSTQIRSEALPSYVGTRVMRFELHQCQPCHAGIHDFDFGYLRDCFAKLKYLEVLGSCGAIFKLDTTVDEVAKQAAWSQLVRTNDNFGPGARKETDHYNIVACKAVREVIADIVAAKRAGAGFGVAGLEAILRVLMWC